MKITWCFVLLTLCLGSRGAYGQAPKPEPILQDRPDAHVSADDATLGPKFESLSAGISFRPPPGMKELRRLIGGDEIVQYADEKSKTQFKVSRLVLSKPAPLSTARDSKGNVIPGKDNLARQGMLDLMSDQLKMDMGGAEILRQDTIKLADGDAGLIAARYKATDGVTRLTQRAILQATEQLYYVLDYVTPAPKEGDLSTDPAVKRDVEIFNHVLDSTRLLDQSRLEEEKNQRLYRTRAFFTNLTPPRVRGALVPQQWLRLIKDGKDIGYSYVVEEEAQDLHQGGKNAPAPAAHPSENDGVRVGVRSRTILTPADEQVDAESWMWVSLDRKHEVWSSIVKTSGKDGKDKSGEFGSSDQQTRRFVDPNLQPGEKLRNGAVDAKQPPVREADVYALSVTPMNLRGKNKPVHRELPPYYIPQALAHLLPRLLPRWEVKGYVFASYVPDEQKVVLRYVDVLPEDEVTLAGEKVRAIPITDRLGYEGSVTTHYLSPDGKYLGSVNEDSKITILPTDAPTLEKLWKDVNLSRPENLEAPK